MKITYNTPSLSTVIAIIVTIFLSACGSEPAVPPTATNSPTPTKTSTPRATETPEPTATPTPKPELATPRWMILGQPGYNIDILGEQWYYYSDVWSESHACTRYQQGDYARFFEQCFGIIDEDTSTLTYDGILDPMLENGFEELTPQTTFPDIDRISLSGVRTEDGMVRFFEIIEAKPYIFVVEMAITTEEGPSLQEIYEENAADVIDYALLDSMQKSKVVPQPSPTPMSPEQQNNYDENKGFLITESEANELYYGSWELLDDYVWEYNICREFEDRTNADVLWVNFVNCVYTVAPGTSMQAIRDHFLEPDDVIPESRYVTDNYFVYGYGNGHLYYNAVLYENGHAFRAVIETRSIVGTTAENGFTEEIDDYLHAVLKKNLEKSE
jgi:hypothetical protein